MRSKTESVLTEMSDTVPTGGDTTGLPVAVMTSPTFSTISRGSSGFPVACAGHTEVQRPHTVHASVSSNCFQVKSSIFTAPKLSSSVSMRFGIGFIAPLGRSRSFMYMFMGDVNMWRSLVVGRIAKNKRNATTWIPHSHWCVFCSVFTDQVSINPDKRIADERPLLEHRLVLERDARGLHEEAGQADHEERRQNERVLGLGLDANAVRARDVAADDRPRDPDQEQHAGGVGAGRIREVRVAVQELEAVGELVIDLADDRGDEEEHEAEVEARVHQTGRGIAEQRLHPHAGAVVLGPLLDVLLVRAAVVGLAALVVAHAQRREPRDDEQHRRDDEVEDDLHRLRHVDEDFALHVGVVAPMRDRGQQAAREHEEEHQHAQRKNNLMRTRSSHQRGNLLTNARTCVTQRRLT